MTPLDDYSMKHWTEEQSEFMRSKEESAELAGLCFIALIVMILAGLALEAWTRLFP